MVGSGTSWQQWLWAFSVAAQLAVFAMLFFQGHFRRLPLFTAYIVLNLCQAGFLYLVYRHFGLYSQESKLLFCISEAITLLARVIATIEILHCILGPYRGIWTLAWRLLTVTFGALLAYVALESGKGVDWRVWVADRGFHLAFAIALVASLLLIRYYSIPVDTVYKALLGGFCFYSCARVLNDTIIQTLFFHFLRRFRYYQEIWDAIMLLPFIAVSIVWATAFRKSAALVHEKLVLLPLSVYQQVSPEVNLRLRVLNERLDQFWKVETPHP
jgi:hypothetical protein